MSGRGGRGAVGGGPATKEDWEGASGMGGRGVVGGGPADWTTWARWMEELVSMRARRGGVGSKRSRRGEDAAARARGDEDVEEGEAREAVENPRGLAGNKGLPAGLGLAGMWVGGLGKDERRPSGRRPGREGAVCGGALGKEDGEVGTEEDEVGCSVVKRVGGLLEGASGTLRERDMVVGRVDDRDAGGCARVQGELDGGGGGWVSGGGGGSKKEVRAVVCLGNTSVKGG